MPAHPRTFRWPLLPLFLSSSSPPSLGLRASFGFGFVRRAVPSFSLSCLRLLRVPSFLSAAASARIVRALSLFPSALALAVTVRPRPPSRATTTST
ncbi:hypothetical protein DFH08DRAFT_868014 [Mycena albidolilacea]|uniref:Uncharacterized protein n=1 Tax=Mycena albidolilacea TaxID=1033008 RepID=A0AAD7EQL8_9AGAR|nr:hypothetical protein DFH08DRAFT_868014 [Mycena albidolilacea]